MILDKSRSYFSKCFWEISSGENREEKAEIKIGLAFIGKDRYLPFAKARECIVCEELSEYFQELVEEQGAIERAF